MGNRRPTQKNTFQKIWENIRPAMLAKNALGDRIPLFNRTGSLNTLDRDLDVILSDRDYYTGYLYAAIRNRATRTSQLATDHLETTWIQEDREEDHPYIQLIDSSPSFSNSFFWYAISTFLDLRGVAYVMALRNFNSNGTLFGDVQEFKVLNPFNISRVVSKDGEFGGYYEVKGGMSRVIPKEMIIEIKTMNPFNLDEGFAMADAAKEDQFLNQQAGQYTRASIKNNTGQRGLLTTEVVLDDEDFANFKSAVESQGGLNTGKFIYANGSGPLSYVDMQIDLDKLALDKINEISREKLFAVAGVSKTVLGIEQSGVTRETSKSQGDLLIQNQVQPQLQLIVDALNQDYKNKYKKEYQATKALIIIDSPLKIDREAELKDAEVIKTKAETAKIFIDAGFDPQATLKELELPDIKFLEKPAPEPANIPPNTPPQEEVVEPTKQHIHHDHDDVNINQIDPSLRGVLMAKQTSLENDITNIQRYIVQATLSKISKNELTDKQEQEIISKTERNKLEKELALVLYGFYISIIPLFASQTLKQRIREFALGGIFTMNDGIKKLVKEKTNLSAASHMDTVLTEIYKVAKQAAEEGLSRAEIVSKVTKSFNDTISRQQATRIARTETNRSIAEAQYQADTQFIAQNSLEGRAFKRWVTRSEKPCSFCLKLEAQTAKNPIPFNSNFIDLNDSIEAEFQNSDSTTTRTYVAGYEPIQSGTLHPNCSCIYEIIVI